MYIDDKEEELGGREFRMERIWEAAALALTVALVAALALALVAALAAAALGWVMLSTFSFKEMNVRGVEGGVVEGGLVIDVVVVQEEEEERNCWRVYKEVYKEVYIEVLGKCGAIGCV